MFRDIKKSIKKIVSFLINKSLVQHYKNIINLLNIKTIIIQLTSKRKDFFTDFLIENICLKKKIKKCGKELINFLKKKYL